MGGFGLGNEVENSSSFSFFLSSFHAYSVHLGQGRTGRMPSLAAVSPPPSLSSIYTLFVCFRRCGFFALSLAFYELKDNWIQ